MTSLRVLFVCTANISRSAYAERRLVHLLGPGTSIAVASAGVPGYPGQPMDPALAVLLAQRGGSAEGHVSQSVTRDLLAGADLVWTMEYSHRLKLLDAWPDLAPRFHGLTQFAEAADRWSGKGGTATGPEAIAEVTALALPDSMTGDVPDPHGRGRRAARACADTLDLALGRILPVLLALEAR